MPKVTIGRFANENKELKQIIEAGMKRHGVSRNELVVRARMSERTFYNRLKNPENMTIGELRVYRRELKIADNDLLSVL